MPKELRREIRDRLIQFAAHTARTEATLTDEKRLAEIEREIDLMLESAHVSAPFSLGDSDSDKGILRKIFPAGLPGLEDYRDLPESPHVLLEHAAQQAGVVGQSPELRSVLNNALLLAETHARVLVTGETGTGKDLIARLIHHNSPRKHKPFVVVNCGALTPQLVMSELFGHEPHSFTGADPRGRQGKVEAADGGTLFLDEIADLPSVGQAALLRLLDRGEIQKVGRSTPRQVNVRVLSATHRDLEQMVEEGTFRSDLYFRLFVAELRMPALRERNGDVVHLANHILNVLRIEYGRSTPYALTDDAVALFKSYSWPGNVRQLRHVLEHAFIRTSSDALNASHFPTLRSKHAVEQIEHKRANPKLFEDLSRVLAGRDRKFESFLTAKSQEWFATPELASHLGVSDSSARTRLRRLAVAGVLESEGDRKGRRYRIAACYALDFPSKNSDINSLGELGDS